jgi:AcrR family transcriptional regulator
MEALATIVDITLSAGVAQGTFYVHFPSKESIFTELVGDMGHTLRHRLKEAISAAPNRASAEEAGFRSFFEFVEEHPHVYRIVRQAEFVDSLVFRAWYQKLAEGYVRGLRAAMARGEFRDLDPEVVAYCLMGMGDFMGMRWLLWEQRPGVPEKALHDLMELMLRGLLSPRRRSR